MVFLKHFVIQESHKENWKLWSMIRPSWTLWSNLTKRIESISPPSNIIMHQEVWISQRELKEVFMNQLLGFLPLGISQRELKVTLCLQRIPSCNHLNLTKRIERHLNRNSILRGGPGNLTKRIESRTGSGSYAASIRYMNLTKRIERLAPLLFCLTA